VTKIRAGKKRHRDLDAKTSTKAMVEAANARRSGAGAVVKQRVYGRDGRLKTIFTVDAGSATLGSDLQYAFEKSVAKARKENRKRFGSADARISKH
jgi:hypothetical protein